MHRVVGFRDGMATIKGDNMPMADGVFPESSIVGFVRRVERNGTGRPVRIGRHGPPHRLPFEEPGLGRIAVQGENGHPPLPRPSAPLTDNALRPGSLIGAASEAIIFSLAWATLQK